jgi:hypothetical protein
MRKWIVSGGVFGTVQTVVTDPKRVEVYQRSPGHTVEEVRRVSINGPGHFWEGR